MKVIPATKVMVLEVVISTVVERSPVYPVQSIEAHAALAWSMTQLTALANMTASPAIGWTFVAEPDQLASRDQLVDVPPTQVQTCAILCSFQQIM